MTIDISSNNKPIKDGCCGDGSCGKGQCKCKGGCMISKICGFFCKLFSCKKSCSDAEKSTGCCDSKKETKKTGCCGGH